MGLTIKSLSTQSNGNVYVNFNITQGGMYRYVPEYCAYRTDTGVATWYKMEPVTGSPHCNDPLFVQNNGSSFTFVMRSPFKELASAGVNDFSQLECRLTVADIYCVDGPSSAPYYTVPSGSIPQIGTPPPWSSPNPNNPPGQPNPPGGGAGKPILPPPPAGGNPGGGGNPLPPPPGDGAAPPVGGDGPIPPTGSDPGTATPKPGETDPPLPPVPGTIPTPTEPNGANPPAPAPGGPSDSIPGAISPPNGLPEPPLNPPAGMVPLPGDGGINLPPVITGAVDPNAGVITGNTASSISIPVGADGELAGHIQPDGTYGGFQFQSDITQWEPTPQRDIGLPGLPREGVVEEDPAGMTVTVLAMPDHIYFEDDHTLIATSIENVSAGSTSVMLQIDIIDEAGNSVQLANTGMVDLENGEQTQLAIPIPGEILGQPGTFICKGVVLDSDQMPIGSSVDTLHIGGEHGYVS